MQKELYSKMVQAYEEEIADIYARYPRAEIWMRSLTKTGGLWAVKIDSITTCFVIFVDGTIQRGRHDELCTLLTAKD